MTDKPTASKGGPGVRPSKGFCLAVALDIGGEDTRLCDSRNPGAGWEQGEAGNGWWEGHL